MTSQVLHGISICFRCTRPAWQLNDASDMTDMTDMTDLHSHFAWSAKVPVSGSQKPHEHCRNMFHWGLWTCLESSIENFHLPFLSASEKNLLISRNGRWKSSMDDSWKFDWKGHQGSLLLKFLDFAECVISMWPLYGLILKSRRLFSK